MIKTNPLSINNIKTLAKEIRKLYNVKLSEPFPIMEFLDSLVDKNKLTIQVLDNNDPYLDEKTLALYNPTDNFIYMKESVLEEYDNKIYRANFTLAHELFHFLQAQVLNFSFEEVEKCEAYEEAEWQANEFAGELLLPYEYINDKDEILSKHFHVSLECVYTKKVNILKRKMNNESNRQNENK